MPLPQKCAPCKIVCRNYAEISCKTYAGIRSQNVFRTFGSPLAMDHTLFFLRPIQL